MKLVYCDCMVELDLYLIQHANGLKLIATTVVLGHRVKNSEQL